MLIYQNPISTALPLLACMAWITTIPKDIFTAFPFEMSITI